MSDMPPVVWEQVKEYWHRPVTGAAAVLLALASVAFLVTDYASRMPKLGGWLFIGGVPIAVGLLWFATNRIPRITRGKVGIVLAITCDDDKHDRQVRADFVRSLKGLLEADPQGANFELRVLPRPVAATVDDTPSAERFLRQLRAHLVLFGQVRRRRIQGNDSHLLTFEGIVRHGQIPAAARRDLQQDFSRVIPRNVQFSTDSDALAFEATSQWTDVSTRYVVGLAALLSGDVAYAERLFLDVERRLRAGRPGVPPLREIARRLPERFTQLYDVWLAHLVNRYTLTREREFLVKADDITAKVLSRTPRHPRAKLLRAMCEFVLRRNVPEARRLAYQSRQINDVTWQYSVAFLDAYEGNLDAADNEYRQAFAGRLQDVTVPIQCEEFIHIVLHEEPEKSQLHYCSGLINYYAKEDFAGAVGDLRRFLEVTGEHEFPRQRRDAGRLLADSLRRVAESAA